MDGIYDPTDYDDPTFYFQFDLGGHRAASSMWPPPASATEPQLPCDGDGMLDIADLEVALTAATRANEEARAAQIRLMVAALERGRIEAAQEDADASPEASAIDEGEFCL